MTPQQLRNSILQLAIEGKLVEQRPEEGTGEELYQLIQEEKEELIKSGKLKKQKELPEITEDEIPFEIPTSWKWVRLLDVGDWGAGATPSRSNLSYYGGQIPWLKTGELNDGEIHESSEYITELALHETSVRLNPVGSLLIAMYGATIGKLGILAKSMTTNQACCACIVFSGMFNKYLFYFLLASRTQLRKRSEGGAQPNISRSKLIETCMPLPPVDEQKRIVKRIETIFPLIDRYEEAWCKLKELNEKFPGALQKSILQEAIQGKLCEQKADDESAQDLVEKILLKKERLIESGQIKKQKALPPIQEDEIPFDIPENWEWSRVGTLVQINPKNDLLDESEVAFVPMACIMEGYRNKHLQESRTWGEIKKGYTHFADNDIAIAKITPCFQNRKSVIFKSLIGGFGAGTTEVTIVRSIQNLLSHEYLLWFFKSDYFISNGVKSFTGTAGQQRIHKDYLSNCLIPIPPLNEQRDIVKKLRDFFY